VAWLNPRQRSAAEKAVAAANKELLDIERLEKLAVAVPEYAERVGQLRTKRDAVAHLGTTLIDLDSM
jgi:hypothetical protein